jgi:hypothetical protein
MQNNNAFLKEFLNMRKAVNQKGPAASLTPADVLPKKSKTTAKTKEQLSERQERKEPGLMTIIEDKPHKRVVIEFLQKRANELTAKKMA